jgi:protein TonB
MPLNTRRFGASWFLILLIVIGAFAQAPTSADVLRERITKAKALIAVKSYSAAIYELEGIRRETNDVAVNNAAQVMLMGCYLEQSDYKRAQALLIELFNAQKVNKPNANYYAVAAQVVKGARNQLDRYKSLGLTVSDRNLPTDAVADINKMRETVESVITQSKALGDDKKQTADALPLLEEAISARSGLARDDYDAKRWKEEIADTRENMMNSRSVVNAVDDSMVQTTNPGSTVANTNASFPQSSQNTASLNPVYTPPTNTATTAANNVKTETAKPNETANQTSKLEQLKAPETVKQSNPEQKKEAVLTPNVNPETTASNGQPTRSRRVPNTNNQTVETKNDASAETGAVKSDAPLAVGSLLEYATEKVNPTYPPAAKTMRMTGIVRVDVVVDEDGKIVVENTSGPSMLQRAALDAVKRWKFKPFTRDGQPVKAKGFVSFNFNL